MKYDNYIFDLYGTLVDIHTDEDSEFLWESMTDYYKKLGAIYTPAELKSEYATYAGELLEISEEIQIEKVFGRLYEAKGVTPTREQVLATCKYFRETSTEYIRLYPWSIPMLESLKAEGKGIYLLSNAQRSFTAPELDALGLTPYFDTILISSDCEVKKPNLTFFKMLLKRCNLEPKTCLFVGNDEICDIFGAKKAGMDTYYIHSNISPEYTGKIHATYMEMEAMEKADLRLP